MACESIRPQLQPMKVLDPCRKDMSVGSKEAFDTMYIVVLSFTYVCKIRFLYHSNESYSGSFM